MCARAEISVYLFIMRQEFLNVIFFDVARLFVKRIKRFICLRIAVTAMCMYVCVYTEREREIEEEDAMRCDVMVCSDECLRNLLYDFVVAVSHAI